MATATRIIRASRGTQLTCKGWPQMTAGSLIYIGSQGIVQGTYETLATVARQHFGGSGSGGMLSGKVVVTAGLGGMGGAQPLAAAMAGAAALVIEVDPKRIARRLA